MWTEFYDKYLVYIYIYMQFGSVLIYVYIAQLVRASERNSLVVGSNPTQASFL